MPSCQRAGTSTVRGGIPTLRIGLESGRHSLVRKGRGGCALVYYPFDYIRQAVRGTAGRGRRSAESDRIRMTLRENSARVGVGTPPSPCCCYGATPGHPRAGRPMARPPSTTQQPSSPAATPPPPPGHHPRPDPTQTCACNKARSRLGPPTKAYLAW